MKINKSWLMALAAVAALTSAQTGRAITFGELDNGRHPNVASVMIYWPGEVTVQSLTGILIHPRVLLTAGHGTMVYERGFALGIPTSVVVVTFNDDPFDTSAYLPIERVITHPGYKPAVESVEDFPPLDAHGWGSINIEDVGLIVLKEPVEGIEPAALPPVGFLDELKKAKHSRPTGLIGSEEEVGLRIVNLPQGRSCKIEPSASQRAVDSPCCGNCAI